MLDGGEITREEAGRLIRTKDEDTMLLLAMADKIRQEVSTAMLLTSAPSSMRAADTARRTANSARSPVITGRSYDLPSFAGGPDSGRCQESQGCGRCPFLSGNERKKSG